MKVLVTYGKLSEYNAENKGKLDNIPCVMYGD